MQSSEDNNREIDALRNEPPLSGEAEGDRARRILEHASTMLLFEDRFYEAVVWPSFEATFQAVQQAMHLLYEPTDKNDARQRMQQEIQDAFLQQVWIDFIDDMNNPKAHEVDVGTIQNAMIRNAYGAIVFEHAAVVECLDRGIINFIATRILLTLRNQEDMENALRRYTTIAVQKEESNAAFFDFRLIEDLVRTNENNGIPAIVEVAMQHNTDQTFGLFKGRESFSKHLPDVRIRPQLRIAV